MFRKYVVTVIAFCLTFALLQGCNSGSNLGGGTDNASVWSGVPTAPSGGGEGVLEGIIADETGSRASGFLVAAQLGTLTVKSQTTGTDGKFELSLIPGSYTILVTKQGYANLQQDNVAITANKRVSVALVVSNSAGALSGSIKDAKTLTGVSGVQVDIVSGSTPPVKITVSSNASGTYRTTLTSGNYTVTVTKDGYASASKTIAIAPTIDQTLDFTIGKTSGTMFGNITDQTNVSISGALVRLVPLGTGAVAELTTGSDGKYTFTATAGSYTLSISKTGFATYQQSVIIIASEDKIFDVKLGPRVSMTGTVKLNTTKEVLANIPVKAYKTGILIDSTQTTPEGKFTFQDLAIGLYEVSVAAESQTYSPATYVIQILNDGTVSPVAAELFISPRIVDGTQVLHPLASGTIIDAYTQGPLEYVTCSLKGFGSILSDNKGRFSFTNLGVGTYELTFSKLGYETMTVNFVVKDTAGTYPTYVLPTALNYSLIESPEKNLGSIAGRYASETTGIGVDQLIVRIYVFEYQLKTITVLVNGQQTSKDVSHWSLLGSAPTWIKATRSGETENGANQSASGTFKLTHLTPSLVDKSGEWLANPLYDRFQYLIFVGTGNSTLTTSVYNDPNDVGATKQIWYLENPAAVGRIHSWVCEVKENTTTYLSNWDTPNY